MRPLSLHTSALNDAEYTLFTENLASLLDSDADAHEPEAQTLTVREVRAWMRGRYPGVPTGAIDQILALFPSKDGINGGEFFAALRLVLHVEAGKDVDRALAFVQVHPGSATAPAPAAAPEDAVTPARTPQRHNPFLQPPGPPTPSLTRSKTLPSTSPTSPAAPVLPPRRVVAAVPPVPPPRHPPLPPRSFSPPKPSSSLHVTSTLMKQSLQASKTGQWLKQGQARLEQERVLQVLRSSSTTPRPAPATETAPDYISASESSDGGNTRGRLPPPRPPSIPASASSLEQVALASAPSSSNPLQRAFDDAYRDQREREPPPMHPDRSRRSAPPSVSSRTSSGSPTRAQRSPERDREPREKPRPPPKPRSLTSSSHSLTSPFDSPAAAASQTHGHTTRLTRSNSLRPSPPPPKAASTSSGSRIRPESVHALLGGLGARLANVGAGMESPFGDPVRLRSGKYTAKEKEQRELEREERRREREALVPHQDGSHSHSHHTHRGPGQLVHEDEEDSDSDEGPDYEEPPEEGIFGGDLGDDEDSEWVGVRRFPDSDAESASEQGVGVRAAPVRRDTITPRALERDSLKWPVDVEGEGWRPL